MLYILVNKEDNMIVNRIVYDKKDKFDFPDHLELISIKSTSNAHVGYRWDPIKKRGIDISPPPIFTGVPIRIM